MKKACDQLWEQADSHKNEEGKLWVIAQIGFEMCVFNFNVTKYVKRGDFEHFSPLNLNNWSTQDLEFMKVDYISENIDNENIIQQLSCWCTEPACIYTWYA